MRTHVLLACAEGLGGAILDAIESLSRTAPLLCIPRLVYEREGQMLEFLLAWTWEGVTLPVDSAADSRLWDIYMLVPVDIIEPKQGRRIFRRLVVASLAPEATAPNGRRRLLRPWTMPALLDAQPAVFGELFPDGIPPLVVAGDNATDLATVSYDPSDQDCINDVDD